MKATIEVIESSSERLNRLYKLAVKFKQGKCSVDQILATCKKIRDRPSSIGQTARQALKSELERAGILDTTILNKIDNIDSYIITDPKYTERPFSNEDAKFISEGLIANPGEFIYHIITHKIINPDLNTKDYFNIVKPLDEMLQVHGQSYDTFTGGNYETSDKLHHKYSNPRELPRDDWFYYTLGKNVEGYLKREQTSERIYLRPKFEHLIAVWNDIIMQLEANDIIKTNGFQTKIPNFFDIKRDLFQRMANQNDRILFYFGENGRPDGLKIISEYVSAHPEYFEPCHSFAAPLLSDKGEVLPGAFTASSMSSSNNSFNGIHTEIIESLIAKFCSNYKNEAGQTPTKQDLIEKISQLPDFKSQFEKFLVNNYNQESKKYGLRTDNIAFVE